MTSDVKTAVIAALAALAGTVAGGLVSFYSNRELQDREFARAERARLMHVRASAGLERSRFLTAQEIAGSALATGITARVPTNLREELSLVDRQVLAAEMDKTESEVYASARICFDVVRQTLRRQEPGATLPASVAVPLRPSVRCLDRGIATLDGVIERGSR